MALYLEDFSVGQEMTTPAAHKRAAGHVRP